MSSTLQRIIATPAKARFFPCRKYKAMARFIYTSVTESDVYKN
jgi:hypothetical protein